MFFALLVFIFLVSILFIIASVMHYRRFGNRVIDIVVSVGFTVLVIGMTCGLIHDAEFEPMNNKEKLDAYEKEKAQVEMALDEQLSSVAHEVLEHYNSELAKKISETKAPFKNYKFIYWPFYHQPH